MKLLIILKTALLFSLTSVIADPEQTTTPAASTTDLIKTATETQSKATTLIEESRKRALEIAKRNNDITDQSEALLKRQKEQLDRMDKILAAWEKQQAEYQRYLDTLPKK